MEELKIEVTKKTADALRKVAGEAHITISEVVDRCALNAAPDDPDSAFLLAMEHYLICVSRLSKQDSAQVFGNVCGTFLGSIPLEELDGMVSDIKSRRNWEDPAIEPVTAEEQAEFRKAIDKMVRSVDKYQWSVFYSLLHG